MGDEVYFILSGAVRVYLQTDQGKEATLALLGPGDVIGEMAFLDQAPRSATARTIQPTSFLVLTGRDFQQVLLSHPETAIGLLRLLVKRIRTTDQNIEDLYAKSLTERTLNSLKSLSGYFKNQEIPLSQEDLALILGATRPRVSEVLARLKKQGHITYSRRKIVLCGTV